LLLNELGRKVILNTKIIFRIKYFKRTKKKTNFIDFYQADIILILLADQTDYADSSVNICVICEISGR